MIIRFLGGIAIMLDVGAKKLITSPLPDPYPLTAMGSIAIRKSASPDNAEDVGVEARSNAPAPSKCAQRNDLP